MTDPHRTYCSNISSCKKEIFCPICSSRMRVRPAHRRSDHDGSVSCSFCHDYSWKRGEKKLHGVRLNDCTKSFIRVHIATDKRKRSTNHGRVENANSLSSKPRSESIVDLNSCGNRFETRRQHVLNQIHENVIDLRREIGTRDEILKQTNSLLSDKDEILRQKDSMLNDRDETLRHNDGLLTASEEMLRRQNRMLDDRDQTIRFLRNEIARLRETKMESDD